MNRWSIILRCPLLLLLTLLSWYFFLIKCYPDILHPHLVISHSNKQSIKDVSTIHACSEAIASGTKIWCFLFAYDQWRGNLSLWTCFIYNFWFNNATHHAWSFISFYDLVNVFFCSPFTVWQWWCWGVGGAAGYQTSEVPGWVGDDDDRDAK